MYAIEYSASPQNGIVLGDGVSVDPTPFIFGPISNAFELRNDWSNNKMLMRRQAGTVNFLEVGLNGTDPAVRPETDGAIDLGDLTNTLRWRNIYATGVIRADTRFDVGVNQGHTGYIDDGVNFRATITGGLITAVGASVAGGFA